MTNIHRSLDLWRDRLPAPKGPKHISPGGHRPKVGRQRERCRRPGYGCRWIQSPVRATQSDRFLVSPLQGYRVTGFRTQGGAALCPGLICCCPCRGEGRTRLKSFEENYLRHASEAKWRCPTRQCSRNECAVACAETGRKPASNSLRTMPTILNSA